MSAIADAFFLHHCGLSVCSAQYAPVKTNPILILIAASALFLTGGCSSYIVPAVTRSSRDWQSIQSVGGIALGSPVRNSNGHVLLPIHCDVSGLQAITTRPTGLDSGSVCIRPKVRVKASTIFITIRTTLAGHPDFDSRCPAADLGVLSPGVYSVVYLNPDGSHHEMGPTQVPNH
jgi:hypothetical protein